MIPHLDIEAEYSYVRLTTLIDIEKDDKLVMPALLFFRDKEDMNASAPEFYSIDNPSYIFDTFVPFLERCLIDKLTEEDREEHQDVLEVVSTYQQARELLNMIKWLEKQGYVIENDFPPPLTPF